jgi:hypothetical protein
MPVAFVRPVEVTAGSFAFCRWSLATLLWVALLAHQPWLVAVTGLLLLASAVTGVRRAPMVMSWRLTGDRIWPSRMVMLDERAMRFAHGFGALFCGVTWVLLSAAPRAGTVALVALVLLKTTGAFGFCTASRLYTCAASGGCCGLTRRTDA